MKALETNIVHFASSCFLRIKGTIFRIGVVTTGKSHRRSFQHLHLLYLSSSLTPCAVPFIFDIRAVTYRLLPPAPSSQLCLSLALPPLPNKLWAAPSTGSTTAQTPVLES